jgi:plasmid replication initiation protein
VIKELAHVVFYFENEKEEIVIPRHLLDTTRFENPAGYKKGVLTVAFNPTLRDIIMELAHYSNYELGIYMRFSSWYSMRLWEMLYAFRDKPFIEFDVDKYREWMGCGAILNDKTGEPKIDKKGKIKYLKYPSQSDMLDRTTQEPLKEFLGTELEFSVVPITDKTSGKGRPPIVKIRFELKFQKKSASEKLALWINASEAFKKTYERLKKYKINDDLIVKYAKPIGQKELNSLLHEWDVRQVPSSKNPILNLEHYCNKVIKEVGEKAKGKINPI